MKIWTTHVRMNGSSTAVVVSHDLDIQ